MTVLLFNKFLKKRFYQLSLIGRAAVSYTHLTLPTTPYV